MKNMFALALLPLALACCGPNEPAPGPRGGEAEMPAAGARGAELEAARAAIAQKRCPVMGGLIDPEVHTDHEGRRIYFCCPPCIKNFQKAPQKYLEIVDTALQKK